MLCSGEVQTGPRLKIWSTGAIDAETLTEGSHTAVINVLTVQMHVQMPVYIFQAQQVDQLRICTGVTTKQVPRDCTVKRENNI